MAQAKLIAPFSAGGATEIDAALARKLLELALSAGGDYADLFFEYRAGADYVYEDERVKAVGRGITLGLGVRVTKGDATGYAYCEELTWEAMAEAARTAAQIAQSGKSPSPVDVRALTIPNFYPVAVADAGDAGAGEARAAPARRFARRARTTSASSRCRRRSPRSSRRSWSSPRTGSWCAIASRSCALACTPSPRTAASARADRAAAGGASAWTISTRIRPSRTAKRRRAWRWRCSTRSRRRRDRWRWCWARATRHPVARGDWPRARGRLQPQGDVELLGAAR